MVVRFTLEISAFASTILAPVVGMSWKRRAHGGAIAFIGFMLSPLSWWNDAFINLPLAYGFASLVSLVYGPAFEASWIAGYWLTNVAGFVLLHKGGRKLLSKEMPRGYSWRNFVKDALVSLAYTAFLALLLALKVLKPLPAYFSEG
jgi:hypothetical protein